MGRRGALQLDQALHVLDRLLEIADALVHLREGPLPRDRLFLEGPDAIVGTAFRVLTGRFAAGNADGVLRLGRPRIAYRGPDMAAIRRSTLGRSCDVFGQAVAKRIEIGDLDPNFLHRFRLGYSRNLAGLGNL